jgi:hypothetical protein
MENLEILLELIGKPERVINFNKPRKDKQQAYKNAAKP